MNATICKNCTHHFEGNYCNNCGQTAHTDKMDWHYVWHEVEHGILHADKGLLFTIKELLLRPGQTIRAFIAGKRITYFKPVGMVIFLATIYGFLYHYLEIKIDVTFSDNDKQKAMELAVNSWVASHYTLVILLLIPVYSLTSKIFFRKAGYNYIEHLALNSFLAGLKLLVQILLIPVIYTLQDTGNVALVVSFTILLDVLLTFYIYVAFFNTYKVWQRILRTVLGYLGVFVIVGAFGFILGIIIALAGLANS